MTDEDKVQLFQYVWFRWKRVEVKAAAGFTHERISVSRGRMDEPTSLYSEACFHGLIQLTDNAFSWELTPKGYEEYKLWVTLSAI